MRQIRHTMTLFHYDGAQVFEATDAVGRRYLGVLVDSSAAASEYAVVGVSPEALRDFRGGHLDLRSLMLKNPLRQWFRAVATGDLRKPLDLHPEESSLEESGVLPDTGFVLPPRQYEAV